LRIIGGHHRGKRLFSPPDQAVRPTAERAREALFSILDHEGLLRDACFLDLFCGTGAVGLEAWSRGAETVRLIDLDTKLAVRNVESLGKPEGIHVQRADAGRLGRAPHLFNLVFLDPPYSSGLALPALAGLGQGWLAEDATVIVELAAKEPFEPPPDFALADSRQYGAARFLFLKPTYERSEAAPS
jgi:16S rRNA (guanine966-N2)-methyltransferase